MGGKFTQVIVKGANQSELATYLRTKGRHASVGPTENGMTVLSDAECEQFDPTPMHALCADLSRLYECPCLGIHYFDDDVLYYFLYVNGTFIDEYDSCPDYHDFAAEHIPPRPPTGGDVAKLAQAFGLTAQQMEAAKAALHRDIESERSERFPGAQENPGMLLRSRDMTGLRDMIHQMMSQPRATSQPAEDADEFDTASPAQWRFGHLIEAMGLPHYAIDFCYQSEDDLIDLPEGSIIEI